MSRRDILITDKQLAHTTFGQAVALAFRKRAKKSHGGINMTEKIYTLDEFLNFGMPFVESVINQKTEMHRDENGYVRNFDLEQIDDMRDDFRNKLIEIYDSVDSITSVNVEDIVNLTIENMLND